MRVPHVVVDARGPSITLAPAVDRHLRRVLRLRDGACVSVTDGRGGAADAVLTPGGLEVGTWSTKPEPPRVVLWAAIGKGSRFDLVVEKATELGVASIRPLVCSRGEQREAKLRRWDAIARSAVEQSRGRWLPEVCEPVDLTTALRAAKGVVLHPGARGGATLVMRLQPSHIAVGPEGGFTEPEIEAAFDAGWTVCGLGPRVLRTETAAVVAAALAVAASGGLDAQDPQERRSKTSDG
ncbi:MAG: RsmE family RNA methyltransferase [Acidimicrobiia bacterium]